MSQKSSNGLPYYGFQLIMPFCVSRKLTFSDFINKTENEAYSVGNDLSWAEEHFRHRENIFPGVGAK